MSHSTDPEKQFTTHTSSLSLEKGEVTHNEVRKVAENEYDEETAHAKDDAHRDIDHGFDPAFVKRTRRKVDWRLIPVLVAMYSISQVDRNNLSFARAANNLQMMKDLGMTSANNGYGIASLVFFIPYIILEVPSQIGIRKYGVRTWLGSAVIAWGLVTIGMGFVTNRHGLAGLRAFLGAFEAVLFPGGSFLISCWYPRHEIAQRMAWFYSSSVAVTGFAAIISWGISHMDHTGGLRGWQWIFVIWGIITVCVGIMAWICLVDFPDKASFITEEQRTFIRTRIDRDRGDAVPDKITWPKFLKYAKDLKIWLFAYIFMGTTLGGYQIAFFLPAILASMGFNNMMIQLLVCPVYVWSVIPAMVSARISDKYRVRGPVVIFNTICLVVGASIFWKLGMNQKGARLFGVFLGFGGITAMIPMIVSWSQTSVRLQSKRAFSSAVVVAFGGVGGIVASVAFMEKEATQGYPTGMTVALSFQASNLLVISGLMLWFRHQNKRADRGEVVLEEAPGFRYQL